MAGMDSRTDIVIAGGGISGMTAALTLAEAGFEVTICDRMSPQIRTDPEFDGRAYAIAARCTHLFRALGIWDRIAPGAQPMTDILVTDEAGDPLPTPSFLHFDHRETDSGPFAFMLEDAPLRTALTEKLGSHDRITSLAPVYIAHEEPGLAEITAATEDGHTIKARLMIACDGRRSAIARRAGIGYTTRDYRQSALVSAVRHEEPHNGFAYEAFHSAGPFAILPLTDNRSSIVWTETTPRAAQIHAMSETDYTAELATRFGQFLGKMTPVGQRYTYPLGMALANRYCAPRLALLGDAAHAIHPLAGQGFNLSLKDIAALAEVLVDARRRGEDVGTATVLERYQAWRRPDATGIALACDGLNTLFSVPTPLVGALRKTGMSLVNAVPGLKRQFMAEAAGSSGDLPRLLKGDRL